jgi:hypothetical protein
MITQENYQLSQGSALTIQSAVVDQFGNPVTTYTGSETLTTVIWPGGARPVSCTPATSWIDHTQGIISILITAANSTALAGGRYSLLTTVTPIASDPIDGYGCTIDILVAPGMATPPTTYTTLDDLLRYGRSWLRQLQTDDDQAGFAEQQGRARSWIEDLAHAHYRVASMTMVVGSQAFGPRRSGARSTWLQEQLDANTLMLTDQVRECAAKKALAFICAAQIGVNDSSAAYARLARMYHGEADYLGTCLTLSLDTNGDGFADVNIDCSCTDPMYG